MQGPVAFDPAAAAVALAGELRAIGSPERAAAERRYLKSDLEFFGVTVPDLRRVVTVAVREQRAAVKDRADDRAVSKDRAAYKDPGLSKDDMTGWAVELWREPVHERRMAAVEVLRLALRQLGADDLATVEALIREARTWALVDSLAGDVAGTIALRHPVEAWPIIDGWASDADFWVRRSAILCLLPGIRAGQPDLARFERYAAMMAAEKEFFIRKAIGWVAREISKRDPEWVAAWTAAHASAMSGVTFREAVRRLPPQTADRLRAARQAPPP
jgi:3-methyladenine DNA glycosylase AlkD